MPGYYGKITTLEQRKQIQALREQGYSIAKIAKHFGGMSHNTMLNEFDKGYTGNKAPYDYSAELSQEYTDKMRAAQEVVAKIAKEQKEKSKLARKQRRENK